MYRTCGDGEGVLVRAADRVRCRARDRCRGRCGGRWSVRRCTRSSGRRGKRRRWRDGHRRQVPPVPLDRLPADHVAGPAGARSAPRSTTASARACAARSPRPASRRCRGHDVRTGAVVFAPETWHGCAMTAAPGTVRLAPTGQVRWCHGNERAAQRGHRTVPRRSTMMPSTLVRPQIVETAPYLLQ